jgi:hypothetical protein
MANKQRILFSFLIIFLVAVSPLATIKVHAVPAALSATLDPKNGTIGIKKAGGDWTAVTEATLVGVGDQIATSTDGSAIISISGSMTVDVTSASIVQIEQLEMRDSEPGLIFGLSTLFGIIHVDAATLKPADRIYFLTPTTLATTTNAEFLQIVNQDLSTAVMAFSGSVTVTAPDGKHIASGDTAVLVSGITIPQNTTTLTDDMLQKVTATEIKEMVTADTLDVFKNLLSQLLQHNTVFTTNLVRNTLKLPEIDKTADLAQAISEAQGVIDKITANDLKTTANTQARQVPTVPNANQQGLAKLRNIDGQVGTQQFGGLNFLILDFKSSFANLLQFFLLSGPLVSILPSNFFQSGPFGLLNISFLLSTFRITPYSGDVTEFITSGSSSDNDDDQTGNDDEQGQDQGQGRCAVHRDHDYRC